MPEEPVRTEVENAADALTPFVRAWHLPFNPEDLDLMAFVALRFRDQPFTTAEGHQQIQQEVEKMINEHGMCGSAFGNRIPLKDDEVFDASSIEADPMSYQRREQSDPEPPPVGWRPSPKKKEEKQSFWFSDEMDVFIQGTVQGVAEMLILRNSVKKILKAHARVREGGEVTVKDVVAVIDLTGWLVYRWTRSIAAGRYTSSKALGAADRVMAKLKERSHD